MPEQAVQDTYRDAPVAITGASGFVGRHLAARLLDEGARVTVLARDVSRLTARLAHECTLVQGDLLDRAAVYRMLSGAAYVFHCAADVATWGPWENYRRANVDGVRVLLDALQTRGGTFRRLVHVSTLDVYGFPAGPASEDALLAPVPYHYGESKRQGDLLVQQQCPALGLSHVVLRPGNIVGPGSPFVSRIGAALRSGPMLSIDGGRHHAGLVDVQNLLDVLLWAGLSPDAHAQVYNLRDSWDVCWADYLRDFRQGSGLRGYVLDLDYQTAMVLASVASAPYRWLGLRKEPLLHPLIVQIFGRTCGHAVDKLRSHGAPGGRVDYASSMRASLQWLGAQPGFIKH